MHSLKHLGSNNNNNYALFVKVIKSMNVEYVKKSIIKMEIYKYICAYILVRNLLHAITV